MLLLDHDYEWCAMSVFTLVYNQALFVFLYLQHPQVSAHYLYDQTNSRRIHASYLQVDIQDSHHKRLGTSRSNHYLMSIFRRVKVRTSYLSSVILL